MSASETVTEDLNQLTVIKTISDSSTMLKDKLGSAVKKIMSINRHTNLLSLNARIEAVAAGDMGIGFAVVAKEMSQLSKATSLIATDLEQEVDNLTGKLDEISQLLSTKVRGTRLTDIALTNIDLIDRNLYERSCDVRWWATDNSLIDALTQKTPKACQVVCDRLGQILNSYTVYYDLVLCDLEGMVVANGRSSQFKSIGTDQSSTDWFQTAMKTSCGEDFGFQTVHESPLVDLKYGAVYSCTVREAGKSDGEVLGVLGIVFNWEGLAQRIVNECPLTAEEKLKSRVMIIDKAGLVLADSDNAILKETVRVPEQDRLFKTRRDFIIGDFNGAPCCIAHAFSPGYETYATGWHSLIIQRLDD